MAAVHSVSNSMRMLIVEDAKGAASRCLQASVYTVRFKAALFHSSLGILFHFYFFFFRRLLFSLSLIQLVPFTFSTNSSFN